MSKFYTSNDNKTTFSDRFFLSYTEEEKWLNSMAEKGFHLVKKSFYRYYFKQDTELNFRYTVEVLEHPADSPINSGYIAEKKKNGADLVASYKCRAYFRMNQTLFSNERKIASKTRIKTVATMFSAYTMLFLTSVALFVYNCICCLNFTAQNSKETMASLSEENAFFMIFQEMSALLRLDSLLGNYQSTPLVLMFFILTVIFSIFTAIYFREIIITKSVRKKKIKG